VAFDYCSPQDAFDYGNSAGTATDPVNEYAVMVRLVTAISRAIDNYCQQAFSAETYTADVLRGVVDRDGVLTCYPAVPVMSAPTVAEYRYGAAAGWLPLAAANADVVEAKSGAVVRFLGSDLSSIRAQRIQVRMSYTGGYASQAVLPSDLAWYASALAWLTYQRRSAPMDVTAVPEMGIVIRPGAWPVDIKQGLQEYVKVVAK
jgi:hypothetical protein